MRRLCLFSLLMLCCCSFLCCNLSYLHVGGYQYTHQPYYFSLSAPVFPVYLDANIGEADKLQIVQALEQWNYVFNGRAQFVVADSYADTQILDANNQAFLFSNISTQHPFTKKADQIASTEPGSYPTAPSWAFAKGRHVYIVRTRITDNNDIYYLMLHEIGHTLGAEHTAGGMMSALYTRSQWQCLDFATVKQVAAHQHWLISELNYCWLDAANASAHTVRVLNSPLSVSTIKQ